MVKYSVDKKKYYNAILYFLKNEIKYPTKSKLLKLLYYLDFDHFEKYGSSVTDDRYIRKTYGPVPVLGEEIIKELEKKKVICSEKIEYKEGDFSWEEKDYRAKEDVDFDIQAFSPTEVEILHQVFAKWKDHKATQLQTASHGEAPNLAVNIGEEIPYPLVYYRNNYGEMNPKKE